jgi:hypothetical protein
MTTINLSKCVPGQKLRSTRGDIMTYVRRLNPAKDYYDHEVKCSKGYLYTVTNDGYEYRNPKMRLVDDNNIIEILS